MSSVDPRISAAECWEGTHRWIEGMHNDLERMKDELTLRSRHCVTQAQRLRAEVRNEVEARQLQEFADMELTARAPRRRTTSGSRRAGAVRDHRGAGRV